MNSRKLIALEPFSYFGGSRNMLPGEAFEAASDNDAYALTLARRARLATAEDDVTARAEPAVESAKAKSGTYKTRDMQAGRKAAA